MKIIHFKRDKADANSYMKCFYIPKKNIVLCKEERGCYIGDTNYFSTDGGILEEAKIIAEDKIPKTEKVIFYDRKEFEWDCIKIQNLIRYTLSKMKTEKKVRIGFEELINRLNPTQQQTQSN